MQNNCLKNIKAESVRGIFDVIAKNNSVTRAEIAAETNLSLMTVSKVTDSLLNKQFIRQIKESKTAAGRKAGLLSLNPKFYAVVLDLTSKNFSMSLVNIKLQLLDTIPFGFDDDFFFHENLEMFLDKAANYTHTYLDPTYCIGLGVSLPGSYTAETQRVIGSSLPELCAIPILDAVRTHFPTIPLFMDSATYAAAVSNMYAIGNAGDKTALYFMIGENSISGSVITGGEILRGAQNSAGNLGSTLLAPQISLQSQVKKSNTRSENAAAIAFALYNAIILINPDQVFLECDLYENCEEFTEIVKDTLVEGLGISENLLPLIVGSNRKLPHAYCGLTLKLREMWLTRTLVSEEKEK